MAFKNILVTVDFSEHSERLLDQLVQDIKKNNDDETPRINLVHIVPLQVYPLDGYMAPLSDQLLRESTDKAKKDMEAYVQKYFPKSPVNTIVQQQGISVSHDVIEVAHKINADLIMVATSGAGYVAKLFLGSTALKILQIAECPVYVLPLAEDKR